MKRITQGFLAIVWIMVLLAFAVPALAVSVDGAGKTPVTVALATPDASGYLVDTSTYIYAESYKGRTDIRTVRLQGAQS